MFGGSKFDCCELIHCIEFWNSNSIHIKLIRTRVASKNEGSGKILTEAIFVDTSGAMLLWQSVSRSQRRTPSVALEMAVA
jgi:hypothetical protein